MAIQEKIFGFLSGLLKKPAPFDPSVFGDSLALATQWTPAVSGGSSFCTHRLKKIDNMALEFKMTFGMKLFCFFFMGMGAMFAFGPMAAIYKQYGGFTWSMLFTSLFGLTFCAIGFFMYYYFSRPIVFDLKRRCFTKSGKTAGEPARFKGGIFVDLDRVRALQVLSEYCRGNKSSYYSYELNLVLEDTGRVSIVDHGDLRALREDAKTLGQLLGVPVWDVEASRSASPVNSAEEFPGVQM